MRSELAKVRREEQNESNPECLICQRRKELKGAKTEEGKKMQ